jgi:prepilin-type N-terminal cleavage/methylation domain-containing protein
MLRSHKQLAGFTLIELIVVIGIITLVAGIIIVAVNPARQFAKTRNAQRSSDIRAIHDAILQRASGQGGQLDAEITALPKIIGLKGSTGTAQEKENYLDLVSLAPDFLSKLPFDPSEGNADDTKYVVFLNCQGRVVVRAPLAELDQKLQLEKACGVHSKQRSDYISVNASSSLNLGTSPFTISTRYNRMGGTSHEWILTDLVPTDAATLSVDSVTNAYGRIMLNIWNGSAPCGQTLVYDLKQSESHHNNNWHNIVVMRTADRRLILYYDGKRVASQTYASNCNIVNFVGWWVAAQFRDIPGSLIDEVRIYNAEIPETAAINLSRGLPYNNNLAAYWNFEDSEGPTVEDLSGNNNTGTYVGPTIEVGPE